MNFLLFVFDKRCPSGGLDDVVTHFEREPTEREIFEVVVENLRSDELALEPVLSVQLVPLIGPGLCATTFFEFRTAGHMTSSAFEFALLAEDLDDLGPCALVPLERLVDENGVVWEYCSRDPDETLF
jgi:hypothetical protein